VPPEEENNAMDAKAAGVDGPPGLTWKSMFPAVPPIAVVSTVTK
jgi:hypothetical protein